MNRQIQFYSIPIDTITGEKLFTVMDTQIREKKPFSIFNINVHAFNWYFRKDEFASTIHSADVVICDSDVIRLFLRFFKRTPIEKLTGSRWVLEFFKVSQKQNLRVFLLGDEVIVLEKCKINLQKQFPQFVFEFHHGFFPENEESEVLNKINSFGADILLVGMGMPKQELLLQKYHGSLNSTVRIPIGGAFRYWSGLHPQAPAIMLKLNLEWLHRIYLEPIRLTGRYVTDAFWFTLNLLLKSHQNSGRSASK
ncbi:MAG: WecB/TagA/CpsF family glycosyltransferase [Bacteroidetes bacterium]|nr:WecB/TagA/CpsF family glycosyltransferase [Bacteroidota bacterium]